MSVGAELLQASFEGLGVGVEESFRYDSILNYDKLAGMRERPITAVMLEYCEFR